MADPTAQTPRRRVGGAKPRYEGSCLFTVFKRLLNVQRSLQHLLTLPLTLVLAGSVLFLVRDIRQPGPHDDSWAHFGTVALMWFFLNVSLSLVLAIVQPTWGLADCHDVKYLEFPLFAWQTPALQQTLFFWPVVAWLIVQLAQGGPFYQAPAHCLGSLFGMQMRELALFNSTKMMIAHHLVTMLLSTLIFAGTREFRDNQFVVAVCGLAIAAFEGGSLGVCVWTMFQTPKLYAVIITASHVIGFSCGLWCIYAHPCLMFYATLFFTTPLLYFRQKYMMDELRKGKPSGCSSRHGDQKAD